MTKGGLRLSRWHELRDESHTFLQEAATTLAPLAGLSANALAHLREDWIEPPDDHAPAPPPASHRVKRYEPTDHT
jgi:hypothetical protein